MTVKSDKKILALVDKHFIVEGSVSENFISVSIDKISRIGGRPKIECYGRGNLIVISNGASLERTRVLIHGDENVVHIKENSRLKNTIIRINGSGCEVSIGESTTIEGARFICQENSLSIKIGRDCMLSEEIILRTSDSHSIIDLNSQKRINYPGSIVIEDHVWIGREVHINKNLVIGSGSIVASRAVVTKTVPRNTLVGGLPAKVIKSNVDWLRELQ